MLSVGWKVTITFQCVCNTGSPGSHQLSQKCRSFTSVKRSWTGAFFAFRIFLRNATIGFFEEDRWIFILRRSLIGFRPIYRIDLPSLIFGQYPQYPLLGCSISGFSPAIHDVNEIHQFRSPKKRGKTLAILTSDKMPRSSHVPKREIAQRAP